MAFIKSSAAFATCTAYCIRLNTEYQDTFQIQKHASLCQMLAGYLHQTTWNCLSYTLQQE